ncbi:MAG: lysophospholipid acyltransferase family protein [Myxococcota bacterium]
MAATSWVDDERSRRLMRRWSASCMRRLGIETTVEDHNVAYDDPPYLFVHLNQASLLEPFFYALVIPLRLRIVMNIEFALIPVLGTSLVAMGGRVIVRQHPASAKRVMAGVARAMREKGHAFALSVEGRRSPDGALSPFKRGAAVLAIEAQARVVPFYTAGTYDALPMGEWRPRPGHVHATLYPSIDTRGLTFADRGALTERLRALGDRSVRDARPEHGAR